MPVNYLTTFSGTVVLNGLVDAEIAITANNEDGTVGPIEFTFIPAAGPWTLNVANNRPETHLLGYHDTDNNGLFEASDSLGEPVGNPFLLGVGDVPGLLVEIPSGSSAIPEPPIYVGVQGTVSMDDFPGGTIRLFASAGSTEGVVFSYATLSTPGPFALSAPIDAGTVLVWAVLDEESDGLWDLTLDPFDSHGPFSLPPSGIGGIALDLGPPMPNAIGGSVYYSGAVAPEDILFVALFDNGNFAGQPTHVERVTAPVFPVSYMFTTVADGVWYPSVLLDIGGESEGGVTGPEDLSAIFGASVNVSGGETRSNIDMGI